METNFKIANMRNVLLVLLLAAISGKIFSQCAADSNIYEFTFDGKKYEVVKEKQTWTLAADCAVQRGGYLAEINSLEEQNAIYDALVNGAKVPSNYVSVNDGGGIAYVWIGGNDLTTEGTWVWDGNKNGAADTFWTGQGAAGSGGGAAYSNSYINWGGKSKSTVNEPDDYGNAQDCAGMALAGWPSGTTLYGSAGEWNDIGCNAGLYFVIEYTPSGTGEFQENDKYEVYPNPVKGILYFHTVYDYAEIIDLNGKVHLRSFDAGQMDIASLNPGIYVLKALKGRHLILEKIIRQDF